VPTDKRAGWFSAAFSKTDTKTALATKRSPRAFFQRIREILPAQRVRRPNRRQTKELAHAETATFLSPSPSVPAAVGKRARSTAEDAEDLDLVVLRA
jgi:hypothetical protein